MFGYNDFLLEQVKQETLDKYKFIFIKKNPISKTEYLTILKHNRIKGFITRGHITDEMTKNGISTIGTVYGKGYGDLLYKALCSKFNRILPSFNLSDDAKISWIRKIKNSEFYTQRFSCVGFYKMFKEEDLLNSVITIKDRESRMFKIVNVEDALDEKQKERLYQELADLHKEVSDDLIKNNIQYYSFGESSHRNERYKDIKDYEIPYTDEHTNNEKMKKYISYL